MVVLLQGGRCAYGLCRACCRVKCYNLALDCPGHRILVKTKREKAAIYYGKLKVEEQKQKEEMKISKEREQQDQMLNGEEAVGEEVLMVCDGGADMGTTPQQGSKISAKEERLEIRETDTPSDGATPISDKSEEGDCCKSSTLTPAVYLTNGVHRDTQEAALPDTTT